MPSLTRAEAKNAFDHVMDNMLGRDGSTDVKTALLDQVIKEIFDLVTLDDLYLENLSIKDSAKPSTMVAIKKGDKNILKCFIAYKGYFDANGIDFNYMSLTQKGFDEFRTGPSLSVRTSFAPPNPPPRTFTPGHVSTVTPSDHFKRSIKRNPFLFPTLKDEKYHDVWHRSFVNQARAQNLSQVLDEAYTPITVEENDLFFRSTRIYVCCSRYEGAYR